MVKIVILIGKTSIEASSKMNAGHYSHLVGGLTRKYVPCTWGIILVWFCSVAECPRFPRGGAGGVGVFTGRCISVPT